MQLPLTYILIGITVLISYSGFNNRALLERLLFHPVSVAQNGEWYRLLSSGFVHGSWSHLLINMYVLYAFGTGVEQIFVLSFGPIYGKLSYMFMYLAAVTLSSVPNYFKYKNDFSYRALGASGGTSGIIFSIALFGPWEWLLFPPLPYIVAAVGYLFYSQYMDKKGSDNIGHNAHFWGAIVGLVLTLITIQAFGEQGIVDVSLQDIGDYILRKKPSPYFIN